MIEDVGVPAAVLIEQNEAITRKNNALREIAAQLDELSVAYREHRMPENARVLEALVRKARAEAEKDGVVR